MQHPALTLDSAQRRLKVRLAASVAALALVLGVVSASAPSAQAITNDGGKIVVDCSTDDLLLGFDEVNRRLGYAPAVLSLAKDCVYTVTGIYSGETMNALATFDDRSVPLTVEGNGATIQRTAGEAEGNRFRFIEVALDKTVTLKDLTLKGGYTAVGWSGNDTKSKRAPQGGAIYSRGNLTLDNVTFINNKTGRGGAGADGGRNEGYSGGNGGSGGAVYSEGSLSVINSTFTGNRTGDGGSGGFGFARGGTGGESGQGGAIAVYASLTMSGTEISDNSVGNVGAAGNSVLGGFTGFAARGSGAGVYVGGGDASVDSSLFSGNVTTGEFAYGGGLAAAPGGGLKVTNSTFVGNSAYRGAALWANNRAGTVTNSTFTGNTSENGGDVAALDYGGSVAFANTLMQANGNSSDCGPAREGAAAAYSDAGGLMSDSAGSCGNTATTAEPRLGPLQENGGPSRTRALLTGSPALDAGVSFLCTSADQRGVLRPQGSGCDIGAFEVGVNPAPGPFDGPTGTTVGVATTYSSTLSSSGIPYSYAWSVTGVTATIVGAATRTPKITFTQAGTATVSVKVYAAGSLVQEAVATSRDIAVGRADNVAPTVRFTNPPASAQQGEFRTFTFSASDSEGDGVALQPGDASCGGGTLSNSSMTGNDGSITCFYATAGFIAPVTVKVTDAFGAKSTAARTDVYVNAIPPVIVFTGGPATTTESQTAVTYTYTVTLSVPGIPAPTTSCASASGYVAKKAGSDTLTGTNGTFTGTFQCYVRQGPDTGTASVSYGGTTTNLAITATNVAPRATISGPATVDENANTPYRYELAINEPGSDDDAKLVPELSSCGANGTVSATDNAGIECSFPSGPANSTIDVTVRDKDGELSQASYVVSIENVAPVFETVIADDAVEGQADVVYFSAYDQGTEVFTVVPPRYCVVNASTVNSPRVVTGSLTCTFPDGPAVYDSTLGVSDGTDTSESTFTTNVANSAPTARYSMSQESYLVGTAPPTLSVNMTDAGTDTVTSWTVFWGDGKSDSYQGVPSTASHAYGAPYGQKYITIQVTDEDGTFMLPDAGVRIFVNAGVPTLTLGDYNATAEEGETTRFTFSIANAAGAIRTSAPTCGADSPSFGSKPNRVSPVTLSGNGGYWECTWGDAPVGGAVRLGGITVFDEGPNSVSKQTSVTVQDVAPAFAWSEDNVDEIVEGEENLITFSFEAPDPGDLVRLDPTPTCGAQGQFVASSLSTDDDGKGWFQCRYPDVKAPLSTGPTLTLRTYGGYEQTFALPLQVVPGPGVRIAGSTSVQEGSDAQFTYTVADGFTVVGDPRCGAGTLVSSSVEDLTFTCRFPDDTAKASVSVTATDGTTPTTFSKTLRVTNVAPTVSLGGDISRGYQPNQLWSLTFENYVDPGLDTMQTITVIWGDGTETSYDSLSDKPSHTYAETGLRYIDIRIVDEDGTHQFSYGYTYSPDRVAPVLTLPAGNLVEQEATSAAGASVDWTVTITDDREGPLVLECVTDGIDDIPSVPRASGDLYPIGDTVIHCTGYDQGSNLVDGYFTVRVADTVSPSIVTPTVAPVRATSAAGAVVTFDVTASDAISGTLSPTCSPVSGSTFRIGVTKVTCVQADGSGNVGKASFEVTVEDPLYPIITTQGDLTAEATGPSGAAVTFGAITATDLVDGTVDVTCLPASSSIFDLGDTKVACTATDSDDNEATESFTVHVVDTTAPVLLAPEDLVVDPTSATGAVVKYPDVTAKDLVDGRITASCLPSAGSLFPLGATVVSCAASDSSDNSAATTFTVSVQDASAPVVTAPADTSAEATGPDGATVNFDSATARDLVDGALAASCLPASGSRFALGVTTVTCSATDAEDNTGTAAFSVTVTDLTPPTVVVPTSLVLEATGAKTVATFDAATATDVVDGVVSASCTSASGSEFVLGATLVTCEASDSRHNSGSASFTVTVQDTTSPVVAVPSAVASAATSDAGAKVSFSSSAIDTVDGPRPVECTPSSGSVFERGATTVVCTAMDESANRGEAEFVVTVEGTVLTEQADIGDVSVEIASNLGFAAGQYAVINPGGPDEEVRYVERLGSLHFSAPLAASHGVGTFVTTIAPPGGDTEPPLIAATAPLTVVQGTAFALEASCTDAGVGVQECRVGTADTSKLGSASVDVVAWDLNGNATAKTIGYTVILAPIDPGTGPGVDPGTDPGSSFGSNPGSHPSKGTSSTPGLPKTLPKTGTSDGALAPIALGLLLSGVLIVVTRRRTSA